ncbi:MAG: hypothetical protein WC894_05195 [Patescibacteria group bacterium]
MRDTKKALIWITDILKKENIPFEIDGGMAANIYGVKRKLADIDINVPLEHFNKITLHVKEYITYGPLKYKDDHWDDLMMTLKYSEQDIDICALGDMKYYDSINNQWVDMPSDLSNVVFKEYEGVLVPVIDKETLINYKKALNREVDQIDVDYMIKNNI